MRSPNSSNKWIASFGRWPRCKPPANLTRPSSLLAPIVTNNHPRLTERAGSGTATHRTSCAQGHRRQSAAEEAHRQAKQRLAASDYEAAAVVLRDVPAALRSEETEQLQSEIDERRQEIAQLTEELQQAVRDKRLADMLPRVYRLLALKPDHAYAKALAVPVQKHLVSTAEKRLGRASLRRGVAPAGTTSAGRSQSSIRGTPPPRRRSWPGSPGTCAMLR